MLALCASDQAIVQFQYANAQHPFTVFAQSSLPPYALTYLCGPA